MNNAKILMLSIAINIMSPAHGAITTAQQEFQAKNYAQAKSLFEQQLAQDDKNINAYLFLARIAQKNELLDVAENYIVKASQLIKRTPDIPLDKARDKALSVNVFNWFGTIMEIQAEKSSIFSASDYAKKTVNGYLKAIALFPNNLQYREALINFYLDAPGIFGGSIKKAIKHEKITFDQDANFGYKMLVNCYGKDGDKPLMLTTYQEAIKRYQLNAELFLMRGSYWKGERHYDKAISDYQQALTLPATDISQKSAQFYSWYWIGRISSFNGDHLTRGIAAYQKVLSFNAYLGDTFMPSTQWTQCRMAKLMALNAQNKQAQKIFTALLNTT